MRRVMFSLVLVLSFIAITAASCSTSEGEVGASPAQSKYYCTDSDGGQNWLVKGTVSGRNQTGYFNISDYCSSSTILKEGYCNNKNYAVISKNCVDLGGYTCNDGKCSVVNQTNQTHRICSGTTCLTVNECNTNLDCSAGNQTDNPPTLYTILLNLTSTTARLNATAFDDVGLSWIKFYRDNVEFSSKNCGGALICTHTAIVNRSNSTTGVYFNITTKDTGNHYVSAIQFWGV